MPTLGWTPNFSLWIINITTTITVTVAGVFNETSASMILPDSYLYHSQIAPNCASKRSVVMAPAMIFIAARERGIFLTKASVPRPSEYNTKMNLSTDFNVQRTSFQYLRWRYIINYNILYSLANWLWSEWRSRHADSALSLQTDQREGWSGPMGSPTILLPEISWV